MLNEINIHQDLLKVCSCLIFINWKMCGLLLFFYKNFLLKIFTCLTRFLVASYIGRRLILQTEYKYHLNNIKFSVYEFCMTVQKTKKHCCDCIKYWKMLMSCCSLSLLYEYYITLYRSHLSIVCLCISLSVPLFICLSVCHSYVIFRCRKTFSVIVSINKKPFRTYSNIRKCFL